MADLADYLGHEAEFRGKNIVANRSKKRVVLCGVGALGSRLADLLACQGYFGLVAVDKEKVEPKNSGTQIYGPTDVGRKKADQLKIAIFKRLRVPIEAIADELRQKNIQKILRRADLVVDMFDNSASRNLVRDHCAKHNIPCVHAGMSADGFAEVEWNENYRAHPVPEEGDAEIPCEYPLAVDLVMLTVGFTAEMVNRFIDQGVKQSIHFTLRDLHVDKVWQK